MDQQMIKTMWPTLASFIGFFYYYFFLGFHLSSLFFFLNNNHRGNNRLYQQQLQEGDRNKSRYDRNLEEDSGPDGRLVKEWQGGDCDGEEKLYLRRAMDGRRSGRRRWASTIKGRGAGF